MKTKDEKREKVSNYKTPKDLRLYDDGRHGQVKWVYHFGGEITEGRADERDLLGLKGANLAEMATIGLPVPAGFTLTTQLTGYFFQHDRAFPSSLSAQLEAALHALEEQMETGFGDTEAPLLLSVRPGAAIPMSGHMAKILNIGLNDQTVAALGRVSGHPRFAYDCYRRLIQTYGEVVFGMKHEIFTTILLSYQEDKAYSDTRQMALEDWHNVVESFKEAVLEHTGEDFPQDVGAQIWGALRGVAGSWLSSETVRFRRNNGIRDDQWPAINIQSMVFGNMGQDSASGIAFTRSPDTGAAQLVGEYMINAQGGDLRMQMNEAQAAARGHHQGTSLADLETAMPDAFETLSIAAKTLEAHYRDMQELEFTIQRGKVYILQTKPGTRTARAAIRIAMALYEEKAIGRGEVLTRIHPSSLEKLIRPVIDTTGLEEPIARGSGAAPGVISGHLVFSAGEAVKQAGEGISVILCRNRIEQAELHAIRAVDGIVGLRNGYASHAAILARAAGKPCLVGLQDGQLDLEAETLHFTNSDMTLKSGDFITIDGGTGALYKGTVAQSRPETSADFATLMGWADDLRRLSVRCNADTISDIETARELGAEGVGLCRSENLFYTDTQLPLLQQAITAESYRERRDILQSLMPHHKQIIIEMLTANGGAPFCYRLLDAPLGLFLNDKRGEDSPFHERNPMLGLRGCRIGMVTPEFYSFQMEAVLSAAVDFLKETEQGAIIEILIPMPASASEVRHFRKVFDTLVKLHVGDKTENLTLRFGAMIETPRSALRAGEIARHVDFIAFGTNDLTQFVFGMSRDDARDFLPTYEQKGIFPGNPFIILDRVGVGSLISDAILKAKQSNPELRIMVCGAHAADPDSIDFFELQGVDTLSCAPYRIPVARLAAAQAATEHDSYEESDSEEDQADGDLFDDDD